MEETECGTRRLFWYRGSEWKQAWLTSDAMLKWRMAWGTSEQEVVSIHCLLLELKEVSWDMAGQKTLLVLLTSSVQLYQRSTLTLNCSLFISWLSKQILKLGHQWD